MKNLYRLLWISLILLISSCSDAHKPKDKLHIKIIQTSDVHGALFPYNFLDSVPASSSLAQVHSFVEEQRAIDSIHVLLFDNGDMLQGDPSVYYSNFIDTLNTHLSARIMNFMKYDAATIGNHDIETGHAVYDKVNKEFDFPWLAANAVHKESQQPYFKPYQVFSVEGFKVAVLGLITPAIPNWLPENIWEGMYFEDMIVSARKWIETIKLREKPDVIVGLFHAGVDPNYSGQSADMPKNENASRLIAEQVDGFDIILAGHDHKIWNENIKSPSGKDVLLMGPSSKARVVSVADVFLSRKNDTIQKVINGSIVEMKNYQADEAFIEKFREDFKLVNQYIYQNIGYFSDDIEASASLFGNSDFSDLIHQVQLSLTDADISFTAPLSTHFVIKKGNIQVRDMFKLYRFENLLYTMELKGREIKNYLEHSYALWFNTMETPDDHLLNFKRDSRGYLEKSDYNNRPNLAHAYYNFDSAEGINYTIDISKEPGNRVSIISMADGSDFKLNKKYKVAINSYRGNGGGYHLTTGAGISKSELPSRIIHSTDKDLRYEMMQWIRSQDTVIIDATPNWTVIPEEYYQRAKDRDFKLLFGKTE